MTNKERIQENKDLSGMTVEQLEYESIYCHEYLTELDRGMQDTDGGREREQARLNIIYKLLQCKLTDLWEEETLNMHK